MFEPDPHPDSQPAVYQCQVQTATIDGAHRLCGRPWDREHTILGFAICSDCWSAVHELENPLAVA